MSPLLRISAACLVLLALESCRQCRWCPEMRSGTALPSVMVEPYDVEFCPELPRIAGTRIVGRFRLAKDSARDLANEECLQEVRRRAAAMGGNTIVYSGFDAEYAVVAYAPVVQQENLHANDDLALRDE